jgi:hypothetical protein
MGAVRFCHAISASEIGCVTSAIEASSPGRVLLLYSRRSVMYAYPFVQVGPGERSDGLKSIEGGDATLDRQTGIRVQRATVLL